MEDKLLAMSSDAKHLHKLVKHRDAQIKAIETKLKKEKRDKMSSLDKIRDDHSHMRCAKNDAKELERQKLSRTLMANLCTAADYPDSPGYVVHMINILKNILGKAIFLLKKNETFFF